MRDRNGCLKQRAQLRTIIWATRRRERRVGGWCLLILAKPSACLVFQWQRLGIQARRQHMSSTPSSGQLAGRGVFQELLPIRPCLNRACKGKIEVCIRQFGVILLVDLCRFIGALRFWQFSGLDAAFSKTPLGGYNFPQSPRTKTSYIRPLR